MNNSLYEGTTCNAKWTDDIDFSAYFSAFVIATISLHTVVLLYVIYNVAFVLYYSKLANWKKWTMVTQTCLLVAFGSICRHLILYLFDSSCSEACSFYSRPIRNKRNNVTAS